eukprot:118711_1
MTMCFVVTFIFTAIVNIVCARTYKATTNIYNGKSTYDFSFLADACASMGDWVPARIESVEQNWAAQTACTTTEAGCWMSVVRDDVSATNWYYVTDGAYDSNNPLTFLGWAKGQPESFEACSVLNVYMWHDSGYTTTAKRVLCMAMASSGPTRFPSTQPTATPTHDPSHHPTEFPTDSPTTKLDSIKYMDGNVSCNNLHDNIGIKYDKGMLECIEWCDNTNDCEVLNYFEDFKQINDSRCYIFDTLCDISIDNERKSVLGYFELNKKCVNYPSDWTDNTGDDCDYYGTHHWCANTTILRSDNDFYNLIDYKYELSAIDSCCECGGGIHIMDDVAFSSDTWIDFEHDILCTWEHSAFTPQSSLRNWNNLVLYDFCDGLEGANCNMLIDTQFNENDYDYSMYLCDYTSME